MEELSSYPKDMITFNEESGKRTLIISSNEKKGTMKNIRVNGQSFLKYGKREKKKLSDKNSLEDLLADWTQCCYLLPHKRRLCNVGRVPGSNYCGQHRPNEDPTRSNGSDRIPCPLDHSHNIYRYNLEAHLKVCTVKTRMEELHSLPYYRLNCNLGKGNLCLPIHTKKQSSTGNEKEERVGEDNEEEEEVNPNHLSIKIKQAFDKYVSHKIEEPSQLESSHSFYREKERVLSLLGSDMTTFGSKRHLEQDIAIIEQMVAKGLVHIPTQDHKNNKEMDRQDSCRTRMYVEFGAGRGMLGLVLSTFLPDAMIVLIERAGVRKKADRALRIFERNFHRVRMDIRSCYLSALPTAFSIPLSSSSTFSSSSLSMVATDQEPNPMISQSNASLASNVIVTAKHLCGVATDFALRGLESFSSIDNQTSMDTTTNTACNPSQLLGYAIATCCHHACDWNDYVGSEWFMNIGFTPQEFKIVSTWTGWQSLMRTVASRRPKESSHTTTDADADTDENDNITSSKEGRMNDLEEIPTHETVFSSKICRPTNITVEEMLELGIMSKRLIDQGRVEYLKSYGYDATQQQFIDPSYSPECVVIMASKQSTNH